jgi:hypothetical protein
VWQVLRLAMPAQDDEFVVVLAKRKRAAEAALSVKVVGTIAPSHWP